MKISRANIKKFIRLVIIATVIPIVVQLVAYKIFPEVLGFSFREYGTQLDITQAFVVISAVFYVIALITSNNKVFLYQPVIYLTLSPLSFMILQFADTIDNIGAAFFALFFAGCALAFLHFGVSTIPSSIILLIFRRRPEWSSLLPFDRTGSKPSEQSLT